MSLSGGDEVVFSSSDKNAYVSFYICYCCCSCKNLVPVCSSVPLPLLVYMFTFMRGAISRVSSVVKLWTVVLFLY